MRKNTLMVTGSALLLSAAGYFLRKASLKYGFEPGTGLAVLGSPINLALCLFSLFAAAAAVFAACMATKGYISQADYRRAFGDKGKMLTILRVFAGAAILAHGVLVLVKAETREVAVWLNGILPILAAAGILVSCVLGGKAGKTSRAEELLLAAVPAFCAIRLLLCYQENASDPTLLHYAWDVLALAVMSCATYFTSGYASGVRRTKRTVMFLFLAVYFCGVWLAGAAGRDMLLPAGALAYTAELLCRFVLNLVPEEDENGETV